MTRDEILAMQPGPELDALVAEHVMGYSGRVEVRRHSESDWRQAFREVSDKGWHGPMREFGTCYLRDGSKIRNGKPHEVYFPSRYSTDLLRAWKVFERMGTGWAVGQNHDNAGKPWWCFRMFEVEGLVSVEVGDDTAPLAICKAALLVALDA